MIAVSRIFAAGFLQILILFYNDTVDNPYYTEKTKTNALS